MRYTVFVTEKALDDVDGLYRYIAFHLKMPLSAKRYRDGLMQTVAHLADTAGIYAPSVNDYIRQHYGSDARCIYYKKMSVIYVIRDDMALILRVMASSLIR
jgi:plasmid stabilization system protein ParE